MLIIKLSHVKVGDFRSTDTVTMGSNCIIVEDILQPAGLNARAVTTVQQHATNKS